MKNEKETAFETEEIAKEEMKKATQLACEAVEKKKGFKPSGTYLDMKNGGIVRPWKEHS